MKRSESAHRPQVRSKRTREKVPSHSTNLIATAQDVYVKRECDAVPSKAKGTGRVKVEEGLEESPAVPESDSVVPLVELYVTLQIAIAMIRSRSSATSFFYNDVLKVWAAVSSAPLQPHVRAVTLLYLNDVVPKHFQLAAHETEEGSEHIVTLKIAFPRGAKFDPAAIAKRRTEFVESLDDVCRRRATFDPKIVLLCEALDTAASEGQSSSGPSTRCTGSGSVRGSEFMSIVSRSDEHNRSPLPEVCETTVGCTATLVRLLRETPAYAKYLTHYHRTESRQASYREVFSYRDSSEVVAALQRLGITQNPVRVYSHQEETLSHLRSGAPSVVLTTPTASGKSLTYFIPLLHTLESDACGTVLYLAPTKALEHDQIRALKHFLPDKWRSAVTAYDGDSSHSERRDVLAGKYRVLFSNPDMLHCSILPLHRSKFWSLFLGSLRLIVLDEVHTYRGAFGIHVSFVLRRLRRLCAYHRSTMELNPPLDRPLQFLSLSATTRNAAAHAESITSVPTVEVSESGAAHPEKHFLFFRRKHRVYEFVGSLLSDLIVRQLHTLCFVKSRNLAEIVLQVTRQCLDQRSLSHLRPALTAYRGGYRPDDRRAIEHSLMVGTTLCAICTNAMELGVDIGQLDAVVTFGFPGSVSSLWQQFGRCGRTVSSPGLAIFVPMPDPLDLALCSAAQDLLQRPVEALKVNANNQSIGGKHLSLHALELGSEVATHPSWTELFGFLSAPSKEKDTATKFGIRTISDVHIKVVEIGEADTPGNLLEEITGHDSFFRVYNGAVFLHKGHTYLIDRLDLSLGVAYAKRFDNISYYTKTTDELIARQMCCLSVSTIVKSSIAVDVVFGTCEVVLRIFGFEKRSKVTKLVFDTVTLRMPEHILDTEAVWFYLHPPQVAQLNAVGISNVGQALHGALHMVLATLQLYVEAECPRDLDGISHWDEKNKYFYLLIFDRVPGGTGIVGTLLPFFSSILKRSLDTLQRCECANGCVQCLHRECECYNAELNKCATVELLRWLTSSYPPPAP